MQRTKDRIGILGCGTMGEAVLGGLLATGAVPLDEIRVTTRRAARAQQLSDAHGVRASTDNVALANWASVLILALKPQTAPIVLAQPGMAEALQGKVLVSICAGLRIEQIAALVPGAQVIRAMPNTPCLIREGMTVLAPSKSVPEERVAVARELFTSVGRTRVLEEKHMDAITGLSGSGPAFVFVMMEALADGGVMMGLPRDVAVEVAAQTMQGAARLVLESGHHPAALKDEVTTPAGCTIAGLLVMEDGRIRSTLARTIQEATRVASGLAD